MSSKPKKSASPSESSRERARVVQWPSKKAEEPLSEVLQTVSQSQRPPQGEKVNIEFIRILEGNPDSQLYTAPSPMLPSPMTWRGAPDLSRANFSLSWFEFTGGSIESERERGWMRNLHAGDLKAFEDAAVDAMRRGDPYAAEYRLLAKNGEYCWIFEQAVPQFDADGKVLAYIGSSVDTTERISAQLRLRESESRLRVITDSLPALISYVDRNHIYRYNNKSYEEWLRVSLEDVVDRHMRDVLGDAAYQERLPFVEAALQGKSVRFQMSSPHWDGTMRDTAVVYVPVWRGLEVEGFYALVQDISDLKRTQRELQASEERYRLALEAGNCGTWEWNLFGNQLLWSDRLDELTGIKPGTFSGNPREFLSFVHSEDQLTLVNALVTSIKDRTPLQAEFRLARAGRELWIATKGNLFCDSDGHPERMLGAAIDITDRKHADQERERLLARERASRSEAEHANQMKDEFLATLSHELRTPLNAILGWAQYLDRRGALEGRMKEGAQIIERNARLQARLINDLLDMSSILSGKINLDLQPNDINSVIAAAIQTVTPAATAKEITIVQSAPAKVFDAYIDQNRMQQVIWNLLSNSIKFTPNRGSITISVEENDDRVFVSVRDSGIGIKPDFLPYIFDRFRQADASITRRFGGLGLGLSIVKQLIELHGGEISVASDGENKGSVFTVTLPKPAGSELLHASKNSAVATSARIDDRRLLGFKILIIDDERDARELVACVLSDCRAEVSAAGSADEGLELFRRIRPDVVISDIGMPGRDGYEFMKEVRTLSEANGGSTPAICLTAFAGTEYMAKAASAGYQAFLRKPIEAEALIQAVIKAAKNAETAL